MPDFLSLGHRKTSLSSWSLHIKGCTQNVSNTGIFLCCAESMQVPDLTCAFIQPCKNYLACWADFCKEAAWWWWCYHNFVIMIIIMLVIYTLYYVVLVAFLLLFAEKEERDYNVGLTFHSFFLSCYNALWQHYYTLLHVVLYCYICRFYLLSYTKPHKLCLILSIIPSGSWSTFSSHCVFMEF